MGALTESIPKPLIEIAGKTLLEHKFDALPEEVDEIILIVGYLGGKIQERFGGNYKGKRILYVEQEILDGTAGALWQAKDLLKGKFLVMNGDDIYAANDIRESIKYEWAVLVLKVDELGSAGNVIINEQGNVTDIIEKEAHQGGPGYANAALYVLDERIFNYARIKRPLSDEYGLPQTIVQAADQIPIHAVEASLLIRITSPEDIKIAEETLKKIP